MSLIGPWDAFGCRRQWINAQWSKGLFESTQFDVWGLRVWKMSPQAKKFWLLLLISGAIFVALWLAVEVLVGAKLPWLVVAALVVMVGLMLHKRLIYRPANDRGTVLSFISVALIYLTPAVICWTTVIVVVTRNHLPSLGGIWAQFLVLVGVVGLVQFLVQQELVALRQK